MTPSNKNAIMMKSLVFTKSKDKMEATNLPKPTPASGELLVRVQYSALDTVFDHIKHCEIASYFIRDMRSDPLRAGYHYSGAVVDAGTQVADFKVGDKVFGHLQYNSKQQQGTFGEYIIVNPNECAIKPPSIDSQVAAASATESTTALQSLRNLGGLRPGQSVLILGAGGSVGSAAVSIAKALGAKHVAAVCSSKDVEKVHKLGADKIFDRTKDQSPFNDASAKYDVVFDTPSCYSYWQATKVLRRGGAFVQTIPTPSRLFLGWWVPMFTGKVWKSTECDSNRADLELIGRWLANGSLPVDIDSVHDVRDFAVAWKRFEDRNKQGRVVVKVQDSW